MDGVKLLSIGAETYAENKSATANLVQSGCLLGEKHRLPVGQGHQSGAELNPLGYAGGRCQGNDGFIMAGKTESLGAGGSDGWIVRVSSPELPVPTTDGTANTPGLGGPVLLPFMLAFLVLIWMKKRYR